LHEHNPNGDNFYTYKGRPTWGAAADAVDASPDEYAEDPKGRKYTCWYWANDRKCNFPADECRYLHRYSIAGIASKPNGYNKWASKWQMQTWRPESRGDWKAESVADSGVGDATSVADWDASPKEDQRPGWEIDAQRVDPRPAWEIEQSEQGGGDLVLEEVGEEATRNWGVIGDGGVGGWGRDTPAPDPKSPTTAPYVPPQYRNQAAAEW
jgi:hypothetical protein